MFAIKNIFMLILLLISLSQLMCESGNYLIFGPPLPPNEFKNDGEFLGYMNKLKEYYILVSRPRFESSHDINHFHNFFQMKYPKCHREYCETAETH
ncbi:hypothetical protein A3Q56_01118 [Intoshia linei]|uniref:Uncharacterized protein n=1 Tax=Intoshia linei TaxID=1819745 RepID=A0A177BBR7_9BILA|nr:hypothetical protein A3Q56_01118 [Intoshia linei]